VAYTAEIQIAVKGAKDLRSFQTELNRSSDAVDRLNRDIRTLSEGGIPRTFNNLSNLLADAAENFNKVALNTREAATAARDYIRATDEVNAGLRERAALLKQVADEERRTRLATAGISETTQYAGPIGPGAASSVALSSQLRGRTQQILDEREGARQLAAALAELEERRRLETNALLDEKAAQVQLNMARQEEKRKLLAGAAQQYQYPIGPTQRSTRFRFENDVSPERAETALRARELEKQRQVNQQLFAEEKTQIAQLDTARAAAAKKQTERITTLSKTIKGSLSSAAIGGAFPLLFGQSPEAAVGGAVGGLLGGAQGGFAGSLIGTALGEIAAKQNIVKELSTDLGLAANQTAVLATAFAQAGRNSEQFQTAVLQIQGLSIAVQDQVSVLQLASRLTGEYGGSIEKVTKIYADFVSKGKVGISDLTKLTAQGIPIQQALADKYGISRTEVLQYAKDGKISVQDLSDTLFALGNTVDGTSGRAKTGFERFKTAVNDVATAVVSLARTLAEVLGPILDGILSKIAKGLRGLNQLLTNTVSRNLGLAGLAFTTGFESQGIDNLRASLKALSGITPQSREELALLNNQLEDISTNLKRVGAESANRTLATSLQGQVLQQQKRLGTVKFEDTTGLIKPVTVPSNLPPDGAGSNKAANAQQREAKRLATLLLNQRALTAELKNQYDYNAKIFAAEMAKDPMLVRRLQGEQQLVEWGIETAKLLDKEKTAAGQLAIAKAQQAKQGLIRQKTEQDLAKLEKDRKDNANRTIEGLQNELDIKNAVTQAERDRLRIAYEMKVLEEGKQFDPDQLDQIKQIKEQLAAPILGVDLIRQQIGTLSDELTKLVDVGTQVAGIAENIGSSFANSFKGAISGAMTAQEALSSFFQSVADRFLDMAAQIIAKWIEMSILNSVLSLFPGGGMGLGGATAAAGKLDPAVGFGVGPIGFRAAGGPVSAGSPYIVGEKGPELFVPGRSGGIVPNDSLGMGSANVVVNVDASGSNVQGDGNQANQLGKAIGIAVQQELIKQKRPGGLLA